MSNINRLVKYILESKEEPYCFSIFKQVILDIKRMFSWDLSYMKLEISDKCINNDGITINTTMNPDERAGNWTNKKIIYLATEKHIDIVMKYWKITMSKEKFIRLILAHELAHEVYRNILTLKDKKDYEDKLVNFHSPYLDTVKPDKFKEESFCEYVAHKIIGINNV